MRHLLAGLIFITGLICTCRAEPKAFMKQLPEEEQKLANSVDPWGLAFADSLDRFKTHFQEAPQAGFVAGYTHNLVKIWPNKYWFRGEIITSSNRATLKPVLGVTGGTVSFQVAVLPKIGATQETYRVELKSTAEYKIYREEFVKLGDAPYVCFQSESWPDPLVPENTCAISGVNLGVFLVELKIPSNAQDDISNEVVVTCNSSGEKVVFSVPVRVVKLDVQPKQFPLVAMFAKSNLTDEQYQGMCELVLEHHLQPLGADYLKFIWKPDAPKPFGDFIRFSRERGQTVFQLPAPDEKMVKMQDFFQQPGETSNTVMFYSNADEPSEKTLQEKNIPYALEMRAKYPQLKIFLAAEYHPRLHEACDIWLTDLSSSKYDPRVFTPPEKPELWHYYCHLPINFQMRAPLTLAPNMLVDNPALEHRLALWMSWHYQAKGIFIWAGNHGWKDQLDDDFWTTLVVKNKEAPFPYGGIHHGNGFLVYPPKTPSGPALPSLRLKILRDGMEDIAIFNALRRKYGSKIEPALSLTPEVFCHPHYYDHCPETLLDKREAVLKAALALEGKR